MNKMIRELDKLSPGQLNAMAKADRATAGYIRTDWFCDPCGQFVRADDDYPRCKDCGECADPVMVTKWGAYLHGEKLA